METRRTFLRTAALAAAGAAASCAPHRPEGPIARKGRIRHAVAGWCFMNFGGKWDLETLCRNAVRLGCPAVELIRPPGFATVKRFGLMNAATPSHTFVRGMNNPAHWDECLGKLRETIDANAAAGFPNVMTFTGFLDTTDAGGSRVEPDEGLRNCVAGYKKIVGHAEKQGVTLILEPLNTRDAAEGRGHPGYQGDHADTCMEIIRRVGSPRLRLLFDAYHIQVMDGDLIRRIRQYGDAIAHVQVAGAPGRGPLDAEQEIHYPAVMRALLEIGYRGYVAQEFIPTGDPFEDLDLSIAACDV